jgi:prophage maintenance system killer protein
VTRYRARRKHNQTDGESTLDGGPAPNHLSHRVVAIALNHPFVDGNKRTGYVSGMTFLRLNGVTKRDPRLNDPEIGAWLEQIVGRQLGFDEFVSRLRERVASNQQS